MQLSQGKYGGYLIVPSNVSKQLKVGREQQNHIKLKLHKANFRETECNYPAWTVAKALMLTPLCFWFLGLGFWFFCFFQYCKSQENHRRETLLSVSPLEDSTSSITLPISTVILLTQYPLTQKATYWRIFIINAKKLALLSLWNKVLIAVFPQEQKRMKK